MSKLKFICKVCRKDKAKWLDSTCPECDIYAEYDDGIVIKCQDVLEQVEEYLECNEEYERLRDKMVFEITHKHPESMTHIHIAEFIRKLSEKACEKLYREAEQYKTTSRDEGFEE